MGRHPVAVFCDGSVTDTVLDSVFTSTTGGEHIGRAMVVIVDADLGMICQTRERMLTSRGTPASHEAEIFAIRSALELCETHRIASHIVYSDCQSAVDRFAGQPVEWRPRAEMRLAGEFFDKVLRRAQYLRASGHVTARQAAQPHQIEAFELHNAEYREFRLSESHLWARVHRDASRPATPVTAAGTRRPRRR